ncbi:MCE family protein [Aquibium sp. A9E412]|uniref:MlaD family protein n=1 Tax=Aquibium sp. A9E412 TaxID=2976767 RepID=UPI0025AF2610|nr:MCE family protein [Aquibium sp. A9E412]MDN2567842.1 MCE family protein [Aquibium sp. A9E412]
METKANYVVVGIFTVVAFAALFGLVYWLAAGGERGETAALRIRIPGSAAGLGPGSAVLFNGVKVGDVQRVYLDLSNPSVAIADTRVNRLTPITRSTQADVGLAGLTGQANIELKGGNPQEPNLLDRAEEEGTVAEITANPSAVTNLLQTAQTLLTRADTVISQLEGFVGDARQPLTETVENIRSFSAALERNADGVDSFLESVSALSQTMSGVSGQLEQTLASADALINSVDREKIDTILGNVESFSARLETASDGFGRVMDNVESFSARLDAASGDFDRIVSGVDAAVTSIGSFAEDASGTLDNVDALIGAVDAQQLRAALDNFQQASATVNKAAEDVAGVTGRIAGREEDIDSFITNARELAERLNQASVRVDGVLAKLDGLLGSEDAGSVVAEARATLESFRSVADTLNRRVETITEGLARFSGQGLRDVEALVRDTRRTINRIEQSISDLEQNPQRIITGGEGEVRRYDGRQRR